MRQAKWWKNGLSYSRPADPERQILLPVLRPQAFPPLQMQRPYSITGPREAQATQQDAEKARQQKKTVIWSVSFVWLNQTDQMNQINKTNQFEHPAHGPSVVLYAWVIEFHCATIGFPQPTSRLKPAENRV
jgi:hypothetical protein